MSISWDKLLTWEMQTFIDVSFVAKGILDHWKAPQVAWKVFPQYYNHRLSSIFADYSRFCNSSSLIDPKNSSEQCHQMNYKFTHGQYIVELANPVFTTLKVIILNPPFFTKGKMQHLKSLWPWSRRSIQMQGRKEPRLILPPCFQTRVNLVFCLKSLE